MVDDHPLLENTQLIKIYHLHRTVTKKTTWIMEHIKNIYPKLNENNILPLAVSAKRSIFRCQREIHGRLIGILVQRWRVAR
jgi:hypothetical protein